MEAASVTWRPLGELFVGRGLITEAELETALAEQTATGKRLGEILVERGLVSGPDLTSVLMEQLGIEISKEEGYGSGLWAEIKRRHKRLPRDEDAEAKGEDDVEAEAQAPEIALVPPIEELTPEPGAFEAQSFEPEASFEPEEFAPELVAEAEPVVEAIAVDPVLEQELAEIAADYQPPAEPEPEFAAEPLVAESDGAAALRAELADAHADVAHLQDMLADAMIALAALSAEAAGEPYAATE